MQIFYLTLIDVYTAVLLYQQVIWSSIQVYSQKEEKFFCLFCFQWFYHQLCMHFQDLLANIISPLPPLLTESSEQGT